MKKTLLLLTFSLIFLSALRSQPHQNAQMQFVGAWTLRSCTATGKDGKATFPYGQHPSGQIQYDPSGNMMVLIVNPEIPKFKSEVSEEGSTEEISAAYKNMFSYYGTYTVVPDSHLVVHHVAACSFPNWTGIDQKRFYEFRGDQLILRAVLAGNMRYELIWQRKH